MNRLHLAQQESSRKISAVFSQALNFSWFSSSLFDPLRSRWFQVQDLGAEAWRIRADRVSWRTDISGLLRKGVKVPSDTTMRDRGDVWMGAGWKQSFDHKLPEPFVPVSNDNFNYITYQTIWEMFVAELPFHQTVEFKSFVRQLELGRSPYGISTIEGLHQRGEFLRDTWKALNRFGFRAPSENPGWDLPHFYIRADGSVSLGRHANHRVAMLRMLESQWIPARFGGFHPQLLEQLHVERGDVSSALMELIPDDTVAIQNS